MSDVATEEDRMLRDHCAIDQEFGALFARFVQAGFAPALVADSLIMIGASVLSAQVGLPIARKRADEILSALDRQNSRQPAVRH